MTEPTAGDVFEAIVETPEQSRAALGPLLRCPGCVGDDCECLPSRCDDSENVTRP